MHVANSLQRSSCRGGFRLVGGRVLVSVLLVAFVARCIGLARGGVREDGASAPLAARGPIARPGLVAAGRRSWLDVVRQLGEARRPPAVGRKPRLRVRKRAIRGYSSAPIQNEKHSSHAVDAQQPAGLGHPDWRQ